MNIPTNVAARKPKTFALAAVLLLLLCGDVLAQTESADHPAASADKSHLEPAYAHPTLPVEAAWPGATVVLICGLFLAAAAVGIVVRLNTPEEVPVAHSHDEPPGGSHHHGPGGTVQPGPEHDLPGGHANDSHSHH